VKQSERWELTSITKHRSGLSASYFLLIIMSVVECESCGGTEVNLVYKSGQRVEIQCYDCASYLGEGHVLKDKVKLRV